MKKDKVDRLSELIDETGMTQSQFAEKLGIYQSGLSRILLRKVGCGKSMTDKLRISFDINPEWFETGEGEKYLPHSNAELCPMCLEKDKRISIMEKYIKQLEGENARLKEQLGIAETKKVG